MTTAESAKRIVDDLIERSDKHSESQDDRELAILDYGASVESGDRDAKHLVRLVMDDFPYAYYTLHQIVHGPSQDTDWATRGLHICMWTTKLRHADLPKASGLFKATFLSMANVCDREIHLIEGLSSEIAENEARLDAISKVRLKSAHIAGAASGESRRKAALDVYRKYHPIWRRKREQGLGREAAGAVEYAMCRDGLYRSTKVIRKFMRLLDDEK